MVNFAPLVIRLKKKRNCCGRKQEVKPQEVFLCRGKFFSFFSFFFFSPPGFPCETLMSWCTNAPEGRRRSKPSHRNCGVVMSDYTATCIQMCTETLRADPRDAGKPQSFSKQTRPIASSVVTLVLHVAAKRLLLLCLASLPVEPFFWVSRGPRIEVPCSTPNDEAQSEAERRGAPGTPGAISSRQGCK